MAKKSKKVLPVILTILVIVLIAAWYLCGKPYIVPDEQGLMLVMTEEPILPIFEDPSTSSGTGVPEPIPEECAINL